MCPSYASSLTGAFTENEYVIKQLVRAYSEKQRYAEAIVMAKKLYCIFLRGKGREKEARLVFEDITGEASHLSSRERRDNRAWIVKAREELKKV